MTSIRVVIDGCEGHAQCIWYCPQVFRLDDDGYAVVDDEIIAAENVERVRAAASGCPERAIRVEEVTS